MLIFTNTNKTVVIRPTAVIYTDHKENTKTKSNTKIAIQKIISRIIILPIAAITIVLVPLLLSSVLCTMMPEDTPMFTTMLVFITLTSCVVQLAIYYTLIHYIDDRIDPWWK